MNSVAIIYNPKILKISLNKILRRIKSRHKKDFVVFIGNEASQEELCRKNKIFFLNIDVFAGDFDIDEISKTAAKFSKIWHLNLSLKYKNINLGKFFENDIYLSILNTLKSITILENILKTLKTNIFYLISSVSPRIYGHDKDSLFSHIEKTLINNKNREDLRVKINFVEENNTSAVYNEIKNRYRKCYSVCRDIIDSAKYFITKNKTNKNNAEKKLAFLVGGAIDENYANLIALLSSNPNYELCFLLREFKTKTNGCLKGAKYKKFFPHIFSGVREEKNIWKEIRRLRKDVSLKNVFWYKHCNIWKTVLDEVQLLFKNKLHKTLGVITYFDKKLKNENIKLVIGSETENDFNRVMFLLSRELNIKTIDLQNDILIDENYNFLPTYCTKTLVWDKVTALNLIEQGEAESKIELVGKLKYLYYNEKKLPGKRQFCEKAGLNPKDKLVLVALSGNNNILGFSDPYINKNLIKWGITLAENSEGIQVIFRLHPSFTDDEAGDLKKFINSSRASANIFIDEKYPLPDMLKNINLCVAGGTSPILLDAVYFNKPIIYVNTGIKNMISKYAKEAVMVEVNNEDDFVRNVRLLLSNLKINKELEFNRVRFIKEHFPPLLPSLKEKTIRIVESMLN